MSDIPPVATAGLVPAGVFGGDLGTPVRNRLLRALPPEVLALLRPHLEAVTLATRDVLYAPGAQIPHVYFPETLVVSLMSDLPSELPSERPAGQPANGWFAKRLAVEVGTVGCEGMAGLPVFLSGGGASDAGSVRAVAQIAGSAQRMTALAFTHFAQVPGPLHHLLLRYTQAFVTQVAQTAACNAGHRIEPRCARWLLMTHDRATDNEFPLTFEALAAMLGVRRAGAAVAVRALQDADLVHAHRGAIRILDRAGLEAAACSCYGVVRAEYGRLLPAEA